MSTIRVEQQIEFSTYNHHLGEFLSFLKKERGFADATIVNRKRSLRSDQPLQPTPSAAVVVAGLVDRRGSALL